MGGGKASWRFLSPLGTELNDERGDTQQNRARNVVLPRMHDTGRH